MGEKDLQVRARHDPARSPLCCRGRTRMGQHLGIWMGRTPECFRREVRTTKIRRDIWPALLSEEAQLKMCPATPTEGALQPQQMCLASTIASYYVTVKFHIFISCKCYYDSSC